MENLDSSIFLTALIAETERIAKTNKAQVQSLANHYKSWLSRITGTEPKTTLITATSFSIEGELKWKANNSYFRERLCVRLVDPCNFEEELQFGQLDLSKEALLTTLGKFWQAQEFVTRIFHEECGCVIAYPVAVLERNEIGDVICEIPNSKYFHNTCLRHRKDYWTTEKAVG